jgi:subtilisin family serine protease
MKFSRVFNLLMALLVVATSISYVQPAAARPVSEGDQEALYVPGEVVVGFHSGHSAQAYQAQATALAGNLSAQVVNMYGNVALFSFAEDADVEALAAQIAASEGVAFAEPNYVFSIPEEMSAAGDRPDPVTSITRPTAGTEEELTISVDSLRSLRTVRNGKKVAAYPNDPYLWWNWGWWWVGADIVSPNTTASANVCVLDTGADHMHLDLKANIIKGWDFVNNDADPMDDNGHGTHVSGVIAALKNNKEGISGVSTGKVVAVKVLNAQGWGTNFGVAAGINYCANRTDVKVLSMSLGGGYSTAVFNAVDYAVNVKGKLLVAAAGNANSSTPSYPAGHSVDFPNKVLAVAASGMYYEDPPGSGEWWLDYSCRADYSNYGSWVSVVAPGTDIYSTLPWDKPFYLNYYYDYYPRYDYLSGTSMATPFVSAAAARRWGYKPTDTNAQVGAAVVTSGWEINADDVCWPSSMAGIHEVNVAALLDRGAAYGYTYNATTGLPLTGAQFQVYQGTASKGSGVVESMYSAYAEVINLPVGSGYTAKTTHSSTVGAQWTFWHTGSHSVNPGYWSYMGRGSVPNKDTNFAVVAGWLYEGNDLDLNVWLPATPNPLDPGQPASFIVGPEGNAFGYLESDPTGTLIAFPFAIWNREGGWMDWLAMESTTISKRLAHAPLAANAALPYYPGDYWIGITDYGQMVGSDHLLYYAMPFVYIWKDGKILNGAYDWSCNTQWWYPFTISSGTTGSVTLYWYDYCTNGVPYAAGASEGGSGIRMKP